MLLRPSVHLPFARGLSKEFAKRTRDPILLSQKRREEPLLSFSGIHERTLFEIFQGSSWIGTLDVCRYTLDGVTRIAYLRYEGSMPRYVDVATGSSQVSLIATELASLEPINLESLAALHAHPDLRENNTQEVPLYRQDRFRCQLADYEVDGFSRAVID